MIDKITVATIPNAESPQTQNATISVPERFILGHGLDWWNEAMVISLSIAGLIALAVAITTTMVVKLQRQVDADTRTAFSRYKLDAEKSINDAKTQAAQAHAKAAEAELALEQFKAPRTISDADAERMRENLRKFAGENLEIFMFGETTEITSLRTRVAGILQDAGWHVQSWAVVSGGSATGTIVVVKPNAAIKVFEAADALVRELRESKVPSDGQLPPKVWQDNWDAAPSVTTGPAWTAEGHPPLRLLIGSKS